METLHVAVINMSSRDDKKKNLSDASSLIEKAHDSGANWIVLPEIFSYFGPYERLKEIAEDENGPTCQMLAELSEKYQCVIFAGSIAEKPRVDDLEKIITKDPQAKDKVFNTSFVFGRDGKLIGKYRKTHLFHLNLPESSSQYCESDGFLAGNSLFTKEIDGWKTSLIICYDLRFSGLFSMLQKENLADIIVCPAAFTKATGKRHWQLLLQARAIEHQCFVAASNQTGNHPGNKKTYGHSMVVDPWGNVLQDVGDQPGFKIAKLEKKTLGEFRNKLPVLSNRRLDLYGDS